MWGSTFNKTKKIITVLIVLPALKITGRIISFFFRQDPKRVVFFQTEKIFYDNSKYLFEYFVQKNNYHVTILVKNRDLAVNLQNRYPGYVFYALSFKGLKLFFRSKNIIISYGTSAIEFFPLFLDTAIKNIIYLGHGIPMKKIGRMVERWQKPFYQKLLQKYSYATSNSVVEKFILSAAFGIHPDNIWITGSPRNDRLFEFINRIKKITVPEFAAGKKVVLYAPTWRELGYKTQFFPFTDFDAEKLFEFLLTNNMIILLRGHKEEINQSGKKFFDGVETDKCILWANQDLFPDVIEMLPFTDILITDYSGMYFDFLPFNKPMIFIPYDLEQYNQYKGLLFDYHEFTAGQITLSQKDFIEALETAIKNPDNESKKRQDMTRLFYRYTDNNACERIYQQIQKLK